MDPWVRKRKHDAIKAAEAADLVADSMEYRISLIERMKAGELTLEQVQAELTRVKREAKKNGKQTRNQVFVQS
jgi:hypothetical protein